MNSRQAEKAILNALNNGFEGARSVRFRDPSGEVVEYAEHQETESGALDYLLVKVEGDVLRVVGMTDSCPRMPDNSCAWIINELVRGDYNVVVSDGEWMYASVA